MKKDKSSEIDEKDDKDDKQKALFIQRLFAYLIDILIVSLVATLVSLPFIDAKNITSLEDELVGVVQKYTAEEIDINEYTAEVNNISYSVSRALGFLSIATVFVSVVYYVVYQLHTNGQTLGKKLMKIRVVSDYGDLDVNQLIFRSFIANSILFKIISIIFIIFASRNVYFESVGFLQTIQSTVTFVSIFMVMYSKNGLAVHDRLFHTKVIRV